jgi:hypothetical protein
MAEYCSLEDAFRDWTSPVPTGRETAPAINGCTDDKAARAQRRAERRLAKRCKGPQAKYIETQIQPSDQDPDRHTPRMELVEAMMNRGEDYLESPTPTEAKSQANRAILEVQPSQTNLSVTKVPSFFGANLEENYAPFRPNDEDGDETDFMSAFKQLASDKPTAGGSLPIPSVSNFWKPGYQDNQVNLPAGLSSSTQFWKPSYNDSPLPGMGQMLGYSEDAGTGTAFYKALPAPGGTYASRMSSDDGASSHAQPAKEDAIQRRLQSIYHRLDELEVGQKHENAQSETVLFVLSGVFVLFALDLVSKLGR